MERGQGDDKWSRIEIVRIRSVKGESGNQAAKNTQNGCSVTSIHGPFCLVNRVNVQEKYDCHNGDRNRYLVLKEEAVNVDHTRHHNAEYHHGDGHSTYDILYV